MEHKRNRTTADKANRRKINYRIEQAIFHALLADAEKPVTVLRSIQGRPELYDIAEKAADSIMKEPRLNVVLRRIKSVMEQEKNGKF